MRACDRAWSLLESTLEQIASRLTPSGRRSRAELTPHARGPATLSIQRWRWRRPRGMKPSTREIPPSPLAALYPSARLVFLSELQPPPATHPPPPLVLIHRGYPLLGQPLPLAHHTPCFVPNSRHHSRNLTYLSWWCRTAFTQYSFIRSLNVILLIALNERNIRF